MAIGEQYWRIVLTRWRLVAMLVVGCTLMAWAVSVFVLAERPKFESAARLNIVPTSEELGYASRFVRGSTFDGGSVLLGTYAEFAHTRPVVAPIVDRYIAEQARDAGQSEAAWIAANSIPSPLSPSRILATLNYGEAPVVPLREDLIAGVIKGTTIANVEGTYLLSLSVEWDDSRSAAWFANALADAIIVRAESMSRSTGRGLAATLEASLAAKRAELADTVRRSRDLKTSVGVVDIDRQKSSLLEARLAEQAQLTTDRANLDASESQVAALRSQASGKLSSAQGVLEQTLATEGPRASGLKRSVAIREGRIGQIDQQLSRYGSVEDRIKSLDDQATALQTEVTALTERVSFSQTENLANAPRIQLIERATPPLTRSSPKIFFNTLLGLVAGCALAGCALLLLGPGKPRRKSAAVLPNDDLATGEPAAAGDAVTEIAPAPPTTPTAVPAPPAAAPRPTTPKRPAAAAPAMTPRTIGPAMIRGTSALALAEPLRDDEPEEPAMPPRRPILSEPVARIVPPVEHRFPGMLARPANGDAYSTTEAVAQARKLTPWLGDVLAPDQRPLFVTAAAQDIDAQHLSQLIFRHLRQAGTRLRIVDGTQPDRDFAGDGEGGGKPFVYLGGLGQSALAEALAALPDNGHLVVALAGCDPSGAQGGWRRRLPANLTSPVHVVPLAG